MARLSWRVLSSKLEVVSLCTERRASGTVDGKRFHFKLLVISPPTRYKRSVMAQYGREYK